MQNHLTDLDELLGDVKYGRSRNYISEAIRCYRAGAYRSAIITTWVAVCIDIIEKIRTLSNQGDRSAQILSEKFDKLADTNKIGLLEQEKFLLKYACKTLSIISNNESNLLQRIRDDRNICAHPNFLDDGQSVQITAEMARYHIVSACKALLHHEPIRGKILIKKIQDFVAEDDFPTNAEKALAMLESEHYLGRAPDFVFQNLTIGFLKQFFHDDAITRLQAMQIYSALQTISNLNAGMYRDVLNHSLNPQLSGMPSERLKRIFLLPHLWTYIDNPIKQKIMGLIPSLSADDIISYRLYIFTESISELKPTLDMAFEALDPAEKLKVITKSPTKEFKTLAIATFIHSVNYDSAYANGSSYLLPHAQYFDAGDLETILNGTIANNQILPANGIQDIFINLFNKTKQTIPDEYFNIWSEFWNTVNPLYGHNLPTLSAHLTAEGVIPTQTQNADDGQDMDLA